MIESGSTFVQGLFVMAVGMVIVFLALVLIMLATMLLERVFRANPEPSAKEQAEKDNPAAADVLLETRPVVAEHKYQELAAVIATALTLRLQDLEQAPAPTPVRVISIKDEPSLWAAIGKLG